MTNKETGKQVVDGGFWKASNDLHNLIMYASEGRSKKGDSEEIARLLEENNAYIKEIVTRLKEKGL